MGWALKTALLTLLEVQGNSPSSSPFNSVNATIKFIFLMWHLGLFTILVIHVTWLQLFTAFILFISFCNLLPLRIRYWQGLCFLSLLAVSLILQHIRTVGKAPAFVTLTCFRIQIAQVPVPNTSEYCTTPFITDTSPMQRWKCLFAFSTDHLFHPSFREWRTLQLCTNTVARLYTGKVVPQPFITSLFYPAW